MQDFAVSGYYWKQTDGFYTETILDDVYEKVGPIVLLVVSSSCFSSFFSVYFVFTAILTFIFMFAQLFRPHFIEKSCYFFHLKVVVA